MANDGSIPFLSRAVQATRGSTSLRVTIPQVVAETLAIRPGDEVEWVVDPDQPVVRLSKRAVPLRSAELPTAGRADP